MSFANIRLNTSKVSETGTSVVNISAQYAQDFYSALCQFTLCKLTYWIYCNLSSIKFCLFCRHHLLQCICCFFLLSSVHLLLSTNAKKSLYTIWPLLRAGIMMQEKFSHAFNVYIALTKFKTYFQSPGTLNLTRMMLLEKQQEHLYAPWTKYHNSHWHQFCIKIAKHNSFS